MTEKYASGKFCCRSCANSRKKSNEVRNKISLSLKRNYIETKQQHPSYIKHQKTLEKYEQNPAYCKVCGAKLPYEQRGNNTCSKKSCHHEYRSYAVKEAVKAAGGNLNKNGTRGNAKYGTYKNVPCDSS